MNIEREIFRAYDIRGIVDQTLTTEAVFNIGKAVATKVLEAGEKQLIIGRDGRLSGPKLSQKFIEGVISTGCDVINIGQVATPVLYFANHHLNTPSVVMLTGSHNPSNYNGIKIIISGKAIYGDEIIDIYNRILKEQFPTGSGKIINKDIANDYIQYICNSIKLNKKIKVVVDSGNGVCGDIAPKLYKAMGCDVVSLYCEVDGSFPNHHPDPGDPKNLQDLIKAVVQNKADFGFAFDGDGDRLGVIDNNGKIIWPDRLLMLFAEDVLKRTPETTIIYDVKSSSKLQNVIKQNGGMPLMWKTGHSLIKAKMKETNAMLAGEMSGHVFFKERWFGFDDALYTGVRLLEIFDSMQESSSELFSKLPESFSTPELSIAVTEDSKFKIIDELIKTSQFNNIVEKITIDGLRIEFTNGWGLARVSNTTPKLILRFEADTEQDLIDIQKQFKNNLLRIDSSLIFPF